MEVKVNDGVVMFEGEILLWQMKYCVENCVDFCSGVKDVENYFKVCS